MKSDARSQVKYVPFSVGARVPPIGERGVQAAVGGELAETVIGEGHHLAGWDISREGRIERARIVRLVVDEADASGGRFPLRPCARAARGEGGGTGEPESAHGVRCRKG